jgi:hypothetical protein
VRSIGSGRIFLENALRYTKDVTMLHRQSPDYPPIRARFLALKVVEKRPLGL